MRREPNEGRPAHGPVMCRWCGASSPPRVTRLEWPHEPTVAAVVGRRAWHWSRWSRPGARVGPTETGGSRRRRRGCSGRRAASCYSVGSGALREVDMGAPIRSVPPVRRGRTGRDDPTRRRAGGRHRHGTRPIRSALNAAHATDARPVGAAPLGHFSGNEATARGDPASWLRSPPDAGCPRVSDGRGSNGTRRAVASIDRHPSSTPAGVVQQAAPRLGCDPQRAWSHRRAGSRWT